MRLRQNGLCQLCDSNDMETINHLMLECPGFENLRVDFFFSEMTDTLSNNEHWIYNYLCNQCLSVITTNVVSSNPSQARCTRHNIM
jgi:hypothetical protein